MYGKQANAFMALVIFVTGALIAGAPVEAKQPLLLLTQPDAADREGPQAATFERERLRISQIEQMFHEGKTEEARAMLQAFDKQSVSERERSPGQSAFFHVGDFIERLEQESHLVRALAFARFVFDTLNGGEKVAEISVLPLSNALAAMCAQAGDRVCVKTASTAGAEAISAPFDEIEQEALKWRIFAALLSGDVAGSRLLAKQLPASRGEDYPAFAQDIQDLLVFEQLSNTIFCDIQLAVLAGFPAQDRPEYNWLVQRILKSTARRLLFTGRVQEAEAAQRELYAIALVDADPDSPAALSANNELGYLLSGTGRWDEAEPFFRRSWTMAAASGDWSLGFEQEVAAWVHFLLETGRINEADRVSESVWLAAGGATSAIPFAETSYSETRARVLMRLARFSDARAHYQRVYDSVGDPQKAWAATNLAEAIEGQSEYAAAEPYRREAAKIGDVVQYEIAFGFRRVRPKLELAINLAKQNKAEEADRLFEEMLEQASRFNHGEDYAQATTALGYARHLLNTGRARRASELSAQALDVFAARLERLGTGVGEIAYLDAVSNQHEAAMLHIESLLASGNGQSMAQSMLAATQRSEAIAERSAPSGQQSISHNYQTPVMLTNTTRVRGRRKPEEDF